MPKKKFTDAFVAGDAAALAAHYTEDGPIIVGAHVDYRDNHKLFEMVREDSIH